MLGGLVIYKFKSIAFCIYIWELFPTPTIVFHKGEGSYGQIPAQK